MAGHTTAGDHSGGGSFIDSLEETLIAALLGMMTLITFANVVARYGFNSNILWALELTVFMFGWLVLLGASYAVKKSTHLGVDAVIRKSGGRVLRTDIGDRYVAEKMREVGATLGGESSGHIICDEIGPTGDGLGAALKVLQVMLASARPLSELRQVLKKFPQKSGAIKVARKPPVPDCPELSEAMADLERELGESGRVLVRYSGTEPKLRLLVEGPSEALVEDAYQKLSDAAEKDLAT